MGVSDVGNAKYPFLQKELATITRLVQADRPVLGICLGGQLLAHAAGAKVSPHATPELGWAPVTFPFPGGTEPIVMGMVDGAPMFHWHFDAFELPKLPAPANPPPGPPPPTGNSLLSSSAACKNQAFRFKTKLFGFQYHFELDRKGIDALIAGNKEQLTQVHGADGERIVREGTEQHYKRYERLGNRILGNFVQFLKVY
jgi:GMP synthase (glutamine-hydrolysing)